MLHTLGSCQLPARFQTHMNIFKRGGIERILDAPPPPTARVPWMGLSSSESSTRAMVCQPFPNLVSHASAGNLHKTKATNNTMWRPHATRPPGFAVESFRTVDLVT